MSGDKRNGVLRTGVVVSSDPARAEAISRALGEAGLAPRVFACAEAAVEALWANSAPATEGRGAVPAVVVTDLRLPGIDGVRLCRLLRGIGWSALHATPIVIVSEGPLCGDMDPFGLEGVTVLPLAVGDFAGTIQTIILKGRHRAPSSVVILAADKSSAAERQKAFEGQGYGVDAFTSASAAGKAIARNRYDVAILDADQEGGGTLVEAVRARQPEAACIMTTGHPGPEAVLDWMRRGGDAVVSNTLDPGSMAELCAGVRRARFVLGLQAVSATQAAEAQQRETLLNQTEAISHTGSWELDLVSGRLTWSNETYRICGLSPQAFPATYDAFLDCVHPEDRAVVDQAYRRSVAENWTAYEIEHRLVHRGTGEVRYVHEKCLHERDASGTIVRSVGMVQDITDRKRAAEALAEGEANLAAVINASPESAFLIDAVGVILTCNRVAAARLGRTPEDLIGHCIYDEIPPVVASGRRKWVEKVIATGKTVHFEDIRDGHSFSHHVRPVTDPDGEVRRVAIFGHDISEFRKTERTLQNQNVLLGAIRQAQNLFISGHEPRKAYQEMLHILVETTGSEYGFLDEVLHDPDGTPYKLSLAMSDISWDEKSRRVYQELAARNLEFRNLDNLGGAPITEDRVIIANDAPNDPRYRGIPVGHPPLKTYMGIPLCFGEEIIGVAGVANREGGYTAEMVDFVKPLVQACAAMIWGSRALRRDQENLRALQESEAKYRRIAEMANEGIWAMDAQYHTTYVNRRMAEMLGYEAEEMLGHPVAHFMFEEDLGDHLARMAERRKGQGGSYERRFRHKDGRAVWTHVSSTALQDDQGRFAGGFGMFTDLTNYKQVEEAAKAGHARLLAILETIDEPVYVADPETYELLYANRAMLDLFGPLSGAKCYEHLQHRETPCPFCTNAEIFGEHEGRSYTWEFRNEVTARWYRCIDKAIPWPDGRMVRYEMAVDITDRKRMEEALERRLLALTQPLTDTAAISFEDLFNVDDIQRLQQEFADATGVSSVITRSDGTPITVPSNFCRLCRLIRKTEDGLTNCNRSDAELGRINPDGPIVQPCLSGGLWDAGASISVGGKHIASWLIGQVRDESQSEEAIRAYARRIGADEDEAAAAFLEVPAMSRERFNHVAQALFTLANQLSNIAYHNVQQARFISERKKAEQALQASEEWHRALLRAAMDGFWTADSTGRVLQVNEAYCRMSGYTEQELLRMNLADIKEGGSPDSIRRQIENIKARGQDRFMSRHRRKDGTTFEAEISAQYWPVEGGRVAAFVRDVTVAKQQEEALRLQSLVLDQIQDQVTVTDLNGLITFVNQAQEERLGYSKEVLLGHPTTLFGEDPARGATQQEIVEKTLRDGSWRGEVVNFAADGVERVLDCRTQVVRGASGEPIALCGVATDVTDSKRAERAVRESEEKHRRLFETMAQGVVYQGADGRILSANPAAERILGRGLDDLLGRTSRDSVWRTIREDGSALPGDEHPAMVALRTGKPVEQFVLGVANAQTNACTWISVTAIPLFRPGRTEPFQVYATLEDITAQREAEHNYRMLFHEMLDGFALHEVLFDESGTPVNYRYLAVNPAFERMVGIKAEDIVGKTVLETLAGTESYWIEQYGSVATTGEPVSFEHFHSGLQKYFEVTAFRTAPGQFACIFADTTERKRAEEALRESEARLNLALQVGRMGYWRMDCRTSSVEWSDGHHLLFGIPLEDFGGTLDAVQACVHPDDREQGMVNLRRTLEEGAPFTNMYRVVHPNGDIRWLLSSGYLYRDEEGRPDHIFGITQDITDIKLAEEELRRRESLLEQMFEIMPIGLWFADRDGLIVRGNPAGVRIWGAEPHVPLGEYGVFKARRLPSGEEIGADDWALAHTVREGVTITGELLEIDAFDGKKKTILNYTAPVLDEQGQVEGAIVVNQDITELNRLQDQLAQAQKMESVGRLAGGVAHDFNNMLGVILGHAEMALEQIAPTETTFNDLKEIKKAAERSADLTRQLLGFARRQTIAPKVLDLNGTVESTLKMLRRLIGEDIELLWQSGSNLWRVNMDASQVDQVLANLCVNARDAIGGVGRISIETSNATFDEAYCNEHPGYAPGDYVLLAVIDTGCGMSRDTLDKLFEPFFTTKELGKGTGLGLATVYGIVKQNDGFIIVSSEVGQGTTFQVYLPRYEGQASQARERSPEGPAARGHETILLVEDETAILDLARKLLERLGYTVLAAGTPNEAIRLAQEYTDKIDLLMTDVIMPEMNGSELAKHLMALHPGMKRLFSSGYTADIIAHHGVMEPGVHFLQKPYSVANLSAMLRKALDGP